MEKEFEIWREGFVATCEHGTAQFYGKFKGSTFKDAVKMWKNTIKDEGSISCINITELTFWGCRLFDNEKDARKSFG